MILIRHDGRLAATVTRHGIVFAPHIEVLEPDHPIRRWVSCLAVFAHEILGGRLDGPYTPQRAAHFARSALIPDDEFALARDEDDALLAEYFNVPLAEVQEKRRDIGSRCAFGRR